MSQPARHSFGQPAFCRVVLGCGAIAFKLDPGFVPFSFGVTLGEHGQGSCGLKKLGSIQKRGHRGRIPLATVSEKIGPPVGIVVDGLERVEKLGQFDNVNHELVGEPSAMLGVDQFKAAVIAGHLRKQGRIDETNHDDRPQPRVLLTLTDLLRVMLSSVIQQPLGKRSVSEELHLDQVFASSLVAGLDVENRKLVILGIPVTERIEQFDLPNLLGE